MSLQYKRKESLEELFESFAIDPKKQQLEQKDRTESPKKEATTLHQGKQYK